MLSLLLCKCHLDLHLLFIIHESPNYVSAVDSTFKFSKLLSLTIFFTSSLYIFSIAFTQNACFLCLLIFQIFCHSFTKNVPQWLPIILIALANDVHSNPGPQFQNNFFNFMSWNLNSLAKENFQRIRVIEAHNSFFNYDLISICETIINDSVELPEPLLNEYIFVPANNPANTRCGGVGLFYKNSLPIVVRNDLSFDESIVVELKFGRKKNIFYCFVSQSCF